MLRKPQVSPYRKQLRSKAVKGIEDNLMILHREYAGKGEADSEMLGKIASIKAKLEVLRMNIRQDS